ncbi:hypothetical protein SAZ10_10750 [Mesorhizobium sp. BAC0120]|uniref:hypothetical protein n=1 Tax=Mesorhizobium sp. BAC0120 TaxID=3090670 RepID=UPI00298D25AC|nr:hypothetical protein [Mesorhizobium sp. BAC0120]MDW6022231.1 hypothetical protein [Mesorhizobium sp. BAC0120]
MERIFTAKTIFATIAAALFLVVKMLTIAGTIIGLIIHSLDVGLTGSLVLAGLASIPCLLASAVICRWAFDAETDPANQ